MYKPLFQQTLKKAFFNPSNSDTTKAVCISPPTFVLDQTSPPATLSFPPPSNSVPVEICQDPLLFSVAIIQEAQNLTFSDLLLLPADFDTFENNIEEGNKSFEVQPLIPETQKSEDVKNEKDTDGFTEAKSDGRDAMLSEVDLFPLLKDILT